MNKYNYMYNIVVNENNKIEKKLVDILSNDLIKISTYMEMCYNLSLLSHCVSKKVACIFIKDGRILSTGINGTAPGKTNCDEIFNANNYDRETHHVWSDLYEYHAEVNGIIKACANGTSLSNTEVYLTLSPCFNCVKLLSLLPIKRLYFTEEYDKNNNSDWINILTTISNTKLYQLSADKL